MRTWTQIICSIYYLFSCSVVLHIPIEITHLLVELAADDNKSEMGKKILSDRFASIFSPFFVVVGVWFCFNLDESIVWWPTSWIRHYMLYAMRGKAENYSSTRIRFYLNSMHSGNFLITSNSFEISFTWTHVVMLELLIIVFLSSFLLVFLVALFSFGIARHVPYIDCRLDVYDE